MTPRTPRTLQPRRDPIPGERLFVRCEGGPCLSRLVYYPPPLEIEERGGLYVLNDDGKLDDWVYLFVAT